ncbi:hypothetical protein UP10_07565 [Bradyrhizobium sp. LTSPM299]|nr:hypothetical protein UP10_07565 [Bradyrhizobium sp. LTSPM299]
MTRPTPTQRGLLHRVRNVSPRLVLPALVLVTFVVLGIGNERVRSWSNIANIAEQASYLAVLASAQTIVLLVRGFDLSIGNTVSVVSVTFALVATGAMQGVPEPAFAVVAVVVSIGAALLVGSFNGFVVAYLGVNTFVVTLGSLNVCLGLASMLSKGYPVGGIPAGFVHILYSGRVFGLPAPILWAGSILLLLHLVLNHTVVGRAWFLLGDNPQASVLAGIPVRRLTFWAFLTCSFLAAICALMITARTGSGEPNLGGDLTLRSAAAAVIGGVSLRGGVGGVVAVLSGSLFITVLSNGMNFLQINGYLQQIALGLVIIVAVSLDRKGR